MQLLVIAIAGRMPELERIVNVRIAGKESGGVSGDRAKSAGVRGWRCES
jgi:hypothetical protein